MTVPEGTLVTMRAEVYGYTAGTSFNFTIFEDDGLLNDDTVTNLTGTVYATNGTFYVDATWITKWQNDQSGDPEFYFEAASGGVSKKSGKSAGEELVITTRRVWHGSGFTENRVVTPASPTVPFNWSANDRPSGAKLAQVAFIWDLNLGSYADNELELTCYGPGWSKSRTIKLTNANRQSAISFDRDAFPDGFSADSGEWGVRVENMTAGKGNVTFTRLDVVITYFTSLIENPLPASPNNNRKVVVMIHGWNPDGLSFAQHYGGNWVTLSDALIAAKNATTGWDVTRYNWVEDAATGPAGGLTTQGNAVASRDAATAHALHLGKELESKYPSLEKVQLIAHSAGNWVARGAARYLKSRFPNADIQVTSLDAFIPSGGAYAFANMPANVKIFDEMSRGGWSPKVLDNYYVIDGNNQAPTSTDLAYRQTSVDFSGWNINRQLDADGNFAPLYDNGTMDEHSGPVLWYARSVEGCNAGNSATLGGLGFATSLMFTEPRSQIVSITPNPAQPPQDNISFQGSGAVNGASISAYEWSSSLNGVIGSTATFSKLARELTVGSHTISFRVRDSQGNWSSPVTANLTVNNAIPTATMAGVPSVPVSPGAAINLTLGGQDNDENNQAVVAGELSVGGTVVANPIGSYTLTAPTQPGNFTISYRVQDDEGAWSALTNKTLTVQDAQGPTLNITSPANGATVSNPSLTVLGNASDSGRGNNGISSVTVNGVAASGGSATGANTANWSAAITLSAGQNTVTVVAYDSLNNSTTQQISVNYSAPGGPPIITVTRQGSNLILTWPTNDPAFKLEYATNLPVSIWISNPATPSLVSGQYAITNSMTNNFKIYRLKK
ncbi:MAG: Ig-like domain-containing protein [Verrucomicrobiota bacterium]